MVPSLIVENHNVKTEKLFYRRTQNFNGTTIQQLYLCHTSTSTLFNMVLLKIRYSTTAVRISIGAQRLIPTNILASIIPLKK